MSKKLKTGDVAPLITAQATNDKVFKLADLTGKWVALYFYPKAFTPGCTAESCALRNSYAHIESLGATILGISLDKIETQKKFKTKYELPFELLDDHDKSISKAYGALGLLGLYAERKTFVINPEGKLAYIFDKVNSKNHDEEVIEVLEKLI